MQERVAEDWSLAPVRRHAPGGESTPLYEQFPRKCHVVRGCLPKEHERLLRTVKVSLCPVRDMAGRRVRYSHSHDLACATGARAGEQGWVGTVVAEGKADIVSVRSRMRMGSSPQVLAATIAV